MGEHFAPVPLREAVGAGREQVMAIQKEFLIRTPGPHIEHRNAEIAGQIVEERTQFRLAFRGRNCSEPRRFRHEDKRRGNMLGAAAGQRDMIRLSSVSRYVEPLDPTVDRCLGGRTTSAGGIEPFMRFEPTVCRGQSPNVILPLWRTSRPGRHD